jgi:hypothetical protein
MVFVKLFKGLDDKVSQLESAANEWIKTNNVTVRGISLSLAHAMESRTGSGDIVLVVSYEAEKPIV